MTLLKLKSKTFVDAKPTGRFDIPDNAIVYEVQPLGAEARYKLRLANWMSVIKRLSGNETAVIKFRIDNGPEWTVPLGNASSLLKLSGNANGFIGTTVVGLDFDPMGLSMSLLIKDPSRNEVIVARGDKTRPDRLSDDIELPMPPEEKGVKPFKGTKAEVSGILDIRNSPNARGKWSVLLDGVAMPTILLSMSCSKSALQADLPMLSILLTGALREIVTQMAFHSGDYENERWFPEWKTTVCRLAGGAAWDDYFADPEMSVADRREHIDEVVAEFDALHFENVVFADMKPDFDEE